MGALLPPVLYFGIHLVEGETLTPMLLARRFTLNPVLIILSLVFWFWMWGMLGAILAVPMLAILKIVCDRLRPLKALAPDVQFHQMPRKPFTGLVRFSERSASVPYRLSAQ